MIYPGVQYIAWILLWTDDGAKGLIIINVYCPRFDSENPEGRDIFKMKFNKLLELRANALITAGFHVVILGDINISHKPIDHCDPYDVSNAYKFYDAST